MENLLSILLLCNNLATFDYQSFEFEGLVSDNSNHKWHIETRYLILNSKYAAFIWNSRCVVAKKKGTRNVPPTFLTTIAGRRGTFSANAQWNPPPFDEVKPTTFDQVKPSTFVPRPQSPTPRRKDCSLPGYGEEGLNSQPPYVLKPNFLSKFWTKIEKYCKPLSGFRKSC